MTGIDPSLFELFREEVRTHTAALGRGLIDLESEPGNAARIEPLMRAAHSLKGAARIVGSDEAVRLAHAMEDALVAAQAGKLTIAAADIDVLLQGTDLLAGLGSLASAAAIRDWTETSERSIARLEPIYRALAEGASSRGSQVQLAPAAPPPVATKTSLPPQTLPVVSTTDAVDVLELPPPYANPNIPSESIALGDEHPMFDQFREEVRTHLLGLIAALHRIAESPVPIAEAVECLRQLRGAALLVEGEPLAAWFGTLAAFWHGLGTQSSFPTSHNLNWMRYGIAVAAEVLELNRDSLAAWMSSRADALARAGTAIRSAISPKPHPRPATQAVPIEKPESVSPASKPSDPGPIPEHAAPPPAAEAVVRVSARSLNRLMGLAGESLVQARWLQHFSTQLHHLKKRGEALGTELDGAFHAVVAGSDRDSLSQLLSEVRLRAAVCRKELLDQTNDFDDHAARAEDLNSRLYREVIASRMRPFADGLHGLPRLVRDMARTLGKQARLDLSGEQTDVDRDVLERLESPLSHLIRNAVDHGLESPDERVRDGKPPAGAIRVHAGHRAGLLTVTVSDDGRGIDLERLRSRIVERGLNSAELVAQMSEAELLEFLFLPGFTTAKEVTEFSGRGFGLDVVQDALRRIGGSIRITTQLRRGTTFHFQLPITLSVIRAVVVEIAGEWFAFPHTRIDRLLRIPRTDVRSIEHRQFMTVDGQHVGLVYASQLLSLPSDGPHGAEVPVVLLSDSAGSYGLVVDSFRGEQDLVVRPLDPRLGKVADVSAAAILDSGAPVLILDVEDLIRSMDQFIQTGTLRRCEVRDPGPARRKRILVVDDSITVREVERQLLTHLGYEVIVAVDGADGWNQVRIGKFDLAVTDIDMPRMNGLQLVQAIRSDERLRGLPVVIVSYKERDEDRTRGLEVGANAYLTKSSFHDNRFVQVVQDLIGPA